MRNRKFRTSDEIARYAAELTAQFENGAAVSDAVLDDFFQKLSAAIIARHNADDEGGKLATEVVRIAANFEVIQAKIAEIQRRAKAEAIAGLTSQGRTVH